MGLQPARHPETSSPVPSPAQELSHTLLSFHSMSVPTELKATARKVLNMSPIERWVRLLLLSEKDKDRDGTDLLVCLSKSGANISSPGPYTGVTAEQLGEGLPPSLSNSKTQATVAGFHSTSSPKVSPV